MWTFVLAGLVYLSGVAIVLFLKPLFMFTPDGNWKEFGIGENEDRYTPFPFWLFCIVWAFASYVFIALVIRSETSIEVPKRNNRKRNQKAEIEYDDMYDFDDDVSELPKGYYVLNKKATRLSGIPKYVYLGATEPVSSSAESIS
jgi:hypothetical protein